MGRTRSGRRILRGLDTSNGCQDHTTWPYASAPFVCVPSLRSRARSPPCDDVCAPNAAASTAPRPAFSDDRETPLFGDGMAGVVGVIWGNREANYFCREGWTDSISLIWFDKFGFSRSGGNFDDGRRKCAGTIPLGVFARGGIRRRIAGNGSVRRLRRTHRSARVVCDPFNPLGCDNGASQTH